MEIFGRLLDFLHGLLWGPFMIFLLAAAGCWLTAGTKFLPIRYFGIVVKSTLGTLFAPKRADREGITPFQAVTTALAGTLGTGNLAGVATAIVAGGPGAIFWMWAAAFFGMATKYSEVLLAVRFRKKNKSGQYEGGPMFYLRDGIGAPALAWLFALFCVAASLGMGNAVQVNSMAAAAFTAFDIPTATTSTVAAVIAGLVILGGIRRIAAFTEKVIPFITLLYIAAGTVVLIINRERLPESIAMIFSCAFSPRAASGGVAGFSVMQSIKMGVSRGIFSNEAGLGSAPIAHASSCAESPGAQGCWGIFEVFADTFLICTFSALIILSADGFAQSGLNGAQLTSFAFASALGSAGEVIVALSLAIFGLSTIISWEHYGEAALCYITGDGRLVRVIYRIIYILVTASAASMGTEEVFKISEVFNGLMAVPNLIGVTVLSGVVFKETENFLRKELFYKSDRTVFAKMQQQRSQKRS